MKTLIVYATKYGCTKKCAEILGEKLEGEVDLCNIKNVESIDLTQYDKVVIGGSIYAGQLQKGLRDFCSEKIDILTSKKLGLFICGMLIQKAEEELNNSYDKKLLDNAV